MKCFSKPTALRIHGLVMSITVNSSVSMKSLNKVLSSVLSGGVASNKQRRNRNNSKRTRRLGRIPYPRRRSMRSDAGAWSRALPASYASHVKAAFRMSRTGDGVRVSGCDLVTPLPSVIETVSGTNEYLFAVITANPLYWTGTRIAQIGAAYMNYRPLSMVFRYIPQVAVTQAGTVIMGTLWNGSAPSADLQQTLLTSNGGCMINCYVPGNTRVKLGTNLQQNLFTCNGDINPDTSPFIFVATTRGCVSNGNSNEQVVPGYFYVEYEYEFKNPIGQSWTYLRSAPVEYSSVDWSLPNRSIVLLQQAAGFGPGTVLDVEVDGGSTVVKYRGTTVTLPTSTYVQAFQNGQNSAITGIALATVATNQYITYVELDHGGTRYPIQWKFSDAYLPDVAAKQNQYIMKASQAGPSNDPYYSYTFYNTSNVSTVTASTTSPVGLVTLPAGEAFQSMWLVTQDGIYINFGGFTSGSGTTQVATYYGPGPTPVSTSTQLAARIDALQARIAELEADDAEAAVVPLYRQKSARTD